MAIEKSLVQRSIVIACFAFLVLLFMTGMVAGSPIIDSVYPSSATNDGTVVVTIHGSGLDQVVLARLNKCKLVTGTTSEAPFPGTILNPKSSSTIRVEFDLTGKKVGDYDLSINAPFDGHDDWANKSRAFTIYEKGTTTVTTTTRKVTTEKTTSTGDNTVYFETDPSGATIYLDGDEVGTSTFIYHTSMDGVHDVLVKKLGYEDYSDRVTIVDKSRVRFYAELTPLSSSPLTSRPVAASSGTPAKTVTTNRRSTLKIPTPLGEITPFAEESPANPSLVIFAVGIGALIVVLRRR